MSIDVEGGRWETHPADGGRGAMEMDGSDEVTSESTWNVQQAEQVESSVIHPLPFAPPVGVQDVPAHNSVSSYTAS